MANHATQYQHGAAVRVSRARTPFVCAMPASRSWSIVPNLGWTKTVDHKPEPRRLRVTSP
jgi:hypothetical protein